MQMSQIEACAALQRYLDQTLPETSASLPASLAQHAANCPRCQRDVAKSVALRQGLATLGDTQQARLQPSQYAARAIARAARQPVVPPVSPWRWAASGALATMAVTFVIMLSQRLLEERRVAQAYAPNKRHLAAHRTPPQRRAIVTPSPTPRTPTRPAKKVPTTPLLAKHSKAARRRVPCTCPLQARRKKARQGPKKRQLRKKKPPKRLFPLPSTSGVTFASGWYRFPIPPLPPEEPPFEPALPPQPSKQVPKEFQSAPPPPPLPPDGRSYEPIDLSQPPPQLPDAMLLEPFLRSLLSVPKLH